MISKEYGKHVVECDGTCGDTLDPCDTFDEALAAIKENEWKATNTGRVWQHYCPTCREEFGI